MKPLFHNNICSFKKRKKLLRRIIHSIVFIQLLLWTKMLLASDFINVYTEQAYPLNYTESGKNDAPVVGPATELVRAVLDESGLDYFIHIVPWARAIRASKLNENVLIYSIARTAEREKQYHWIGLVLPVTYSLYGLERRKKELPRKLADAKTISIGVLRSGVTTAYLKQKGFTNLHYQNNSTQSLRLLNRDRFDLFPHADLVIESLLQQGDLKRKHLVAMIQLNELTTTLNIAMSLKTRDDLIVDLQSAFLKVKNSGKYEKIMRSVLRPLGSSY